ncbi:MAG: acetyl-CoA acetyltransferase [Deltaproteobacteria bacterium RIFCSPLOWO2_12_FULL_50_11]|nr:MAG: acetyl-CoA acetyltransferase [Deltaproteobacteria bacterium RIFCSPHIGHO2_02_FULL_50_15]OGQ66203.1 MAG: acetyl-CoA acetyltransferase [Deltaproteobacteria bacterium RIFCSPLOWO2_12_FULL_50_11]
MSDAYIVDAVRTPRGRRKGGLSWTHPIDLATVPLKALVERNRVDPRDIEDIIYGCVSQRNEQDNVISREAALAAGFPIDVPGVTVNRFCGSGLTACVMGATAVASDQEDLVIAGGVEHMTRVPMNITFEMQGSLLYERYPDLVPQGISAEMVSERYGFGRRQLDEFAAASQEKASIAWEKGYFKKSIVPVEAKTENGGSFLFERDEHVRPGTTPEILAGLKTVFKEDGVIHAGNSSGIVDGSAAVLWASKKACKKYDLKPRARFVASATIGSDPILMLLGPAPATEKVLKKAGLHLKDIDLFEINEAFAPVPLAWAKDTGADLKKTNVNGGAIAMGHPLGATGAMLLGTLLDELERRDRRYGLVTLCIGLGMAVAMIIDRKI